MKRYAVDKSHVLDLLNIFGAWARTVTPHQREQPLSVFERHTARQRVLVADEVARAKGQRGTGVLAHTIAVFVAIHSRDLPDFDFVARPVRGLNAFRDKPLGISDEIGLQAVSD